MPRFLDRIYKINRMGFWGLSELKIPQRGSREHPENAEAQGLIIFFLMAQLGLHRWGQRLLHQKPVLSLPPAKIHGGSLEEQAPGLKRYKPARV